MDLVSIIITTYRRSSDQLSRALKSCVEQSFSNIEIVIVDDNINLEFSSIVQEVVRSFNDSRIRIIKNSKNIGGAESRNKGIEESKGIFISFLDDDDFYLKDKIYNQLEFIKKNNFDFIISNLAIVNHNLKLLDIRQYPWFNKKMSNRKLLVEHYKHHLTGTPTFLFKKSILINVKGFPNVRIGHEFHLVNNLLSRGYKMGYLNEVLTVAVNHNGKRISNDKNRQQALDELLIFKLDNIGKISFVDKLTIFHRYYLTKSYAFLKNKSYQKFIFYLIKSFLCNPFQFMSEVQKRILIKTRGVYYGE